MDGRGGCCIARYCGDPYEKSKVDRIMLKYRPIAPKPVVGVVVTGNSSPESKESLFRVERPKRRYVRENNKRCSRKRRVFPEEKKGGLDEGVDESDTPVARLLPLLPEIPDRKNVPERNSSVDLGPIWLNFSGEDGTVATSQPVVWPVGSLVTVERVTEALVDGEVLGSTDEERKNNLGRDTCPGFISDGLNKVEWTNEAYRKMIGEDESEPEVVSLVMKEKLPLTCPAFACPVKIQYTYREEKHTLTVPCDVWRMDGGGFAWRLDVKAALSLGR